ncbi:hypothetical protein BASA62_000237 [Batrachochytrium salamandrivorans]|nr:hypothetical protein BASA62_000237 [Batrachochytrium salamandrivorans]
MRLISFAVISLLAITVSAYPGLGSDDQDLEEPQSTAAQDLEEPQSASVQGEQQSQSTVAQDEQESDHDRVRLEFEELKTEYEAAEKSIVTMRVEFESIKSAIDAIKDFMDRTKIQLEDMDLSDERKSTLRRQYDGSNMELKKLFYKFHSAVKSYTYSKKERDFIKERMDALTKAM